MNHRVLDPLETTAVIESQARSYYFSFSDGSTASMSLNEATGEMFLKTVSATYHHQWPQKEDRGGLTLAAFIAGLSDDEFTTLTEEGGASLLSEVIGETRALFAMRSFIREVNGSEIETR